MAAQNTWKNALQLLHWAELAYKCQRRPKFINLHRLAMNFGDLNGTHLLVEWNINTHDYGRKNFFGYKNDHYSNKGQMTTRNFTFIDLFSGIGGFRMALDSIGGSCLNFSEINPDAIDTYCTNFKEDTSRNLGDITKIKELPKHNILTAGVPCQSWSIAGKNLGFDDDSICN